LTICRRPALGRTPTTTRSRRRLIGIDGTSRRRSRPPQRSARRPSRTATRLASGPSARIRSGSEAARPARTAHRDRRRCGSDLNWYPTSPGRKKLKTRHFRCNRTPPIGADRDPVQRALRVAFPRASTEIDRGYPFKADRHRGTSRARPGQSGPGRAGLGRERVAGHRCGDVQAFEPIARAAHRVDCPNWRPEEGARGFRGGFGSAMSPSFRCPRSRRRRRRHRQHNQTARHRQIAGTASSRRWACRHPTFGEQYMPRRLRSRRYHKKSSSVTSCPLGLLRATACRTPTERCFRSARRPLRQPRSPRQTRLTPARHICPDQTASGRPTHTD